MSGIMNMFVAAKTTVAAAVDSFFNRVTLLLNTGSTNGAQNNTFLDSSSNNFSITRNGNTTQGTFTPFSQTGWSNFFDGTDDYLAIADNALLRFGAGAFTLEAWIYRNASGAAHTIYAKGGASTGIVFQVTSTNVLRFTHTTTNIDSTGTIAANSWNHVAVVREGTGTNQTKLYINGTQDGQGTVSTDFTQTEEVRIGTDRGATADFNGYISNLRFVKGTALYTATFTPSTTPLTTTSQGATATEVELLTCQSNRFLDNSSNAFSFTVTGTPSVQAFSPFAPTASYDAAVVGGSGYFDGTGDCLTLANNAALQMSASDFTLEAWVYTASTANQTFMAHEASGALGFQFAVETNQSVTIAISSSGSAYATVVTSTSKLKLGQWNHVAAVRLGSGTGNITIYINGVKDATTGTFAGTMNAPSTTFQVGCRYASGVTTPLIGYLGGCRVIKGQALYTASTITIPNAPFTTTGYGTTSQSITGAVNLLINFTNAGIYDSASKNVLETVGNAQVSTTQAKWGTTSVYFDGTGDRLLIPRSELLNLANGDFTVEAWIYTTTIAAGSAMACYRGDSGNISAGTQLQWSIYRTGSTLYVRPYSGTTATPISVGTIAANTWYHVALVRSGNSFTGYLNGSASSPTTISGSLNNTTTWYGTILGFNYTSAGVEEAWNGYVDDLRITKGVARTITTPTAAFPTQ